MLDFSAKGAVTRPIRTMGYGLVLRAGPGWQVRVLAVINLGREVFTAVGDFEMRRYERDLVATAESRRL